MLKITIIACFVLGVLTGCDTASNLVRHLETSEATHILNGSAYPPLSVESVVVYIQKPDFEYAVVGSIIATVSATAFGGMISGVGWILAPPSIIGSVGIGILWWAGRVAFRRLHIGQKVAARGEVNQRRDTQSVREDGTWRGVQGPRAVPW